MLQRWYGEWAARTGLAGKTASRRLHYNLGWLAERQFIGIERRRGLSPMITLLNIDASGEPYHDPRPSQRYVQLPTTSFTNGWLVRLSPVATAATMILMNQMQASESSTWPVFIPGYDHDRYGLSENAFRLGAHELEEAKLLTVEKDRIDEEQYLEVRIRNLYTLHPDRFRTRPDAGPLWRSGIS